VDIEVRAASIADTFHMGSANFRFSFNRAAVANPQEVQALGFSGLVNFSPIIAYGAHTTTGSIDTIVSLNTFFQFGFSQDGQLVSTDWVGVSRFSFDILDFNECFELTWHDKNTFPATVMSEYVDDDGTLDGNGTFFDVDEGLYENLNFCFSDRCGDNDGDGIIDISDIDDDNDGVPDVEEVCGAGAAAFSCGDIVSDPSADDDGDNVVNYQDSDYCTLNSLGVCQSLDTDNDGIIDLFDLDSDGDGVFDLYEAGTNPLFSDTLGGRSDGLVDAFLNVEDPTTLIDDDDDGWADIYDSSQGGTSLSIPNTDGDNLSNMKDIDSDNDGIIDIIEFQTTWSYKAPSGIDRNGNGIDSVYDHYELPGGLSNVRAEDTDFDLAFDYIDFDADDDGLSDYIEGWDLNADGLNGTEPEPSCFNGSYPCGDDVDGDGLLDIYDRVAFVEGTATWRDNVTNGNTNPQDLPYNAGNPSNPAPGGPDMDWRSETTFPVEFLSFTAELVGRDGHLEWSTATEVNSDFFTVERSVDGIMFESLGNVGAAGTVNIQSYYNYVDVNVASLNVPVIYYRLKQVDLDGSYLYSNIVELFVDLDVGIQAVAYPNPATDVVNFNIASSQWGDMDVKIVDGAGRVVWEDKIEVESLYHLEVPVKDFARGIYFVHFSGEGYTAEERLILE